MSTPTSQFALPHQQKGRSRGLALTTPAVAIVAVVLLLVVFASQARVASSIVAPPEETRAREVGSDQRGKEEAPLSGKVVAEGQPTFFVAEVPPAPVMKSEEAERVGIASTAKGPTQAPPAHQTQPPSAAAAHHHHNEEEAPQCTGMDTDFPVLPYDTFLRTTVANPEYAYVTFISNAEWVRLAATMFHSVAASGSVYARCVLVTKDITLADRKLLALFAQVIEIDSIVSPMKILDPTYLEMFTKLRIWQLEPLYKKVLYVDADIIVRRNMDDLFDIPIGEEGLVWALAKDGGSGPQPITNIKRTNTGYMLITPSLSMFEDIMVSVREDFRKDMLGLPELLLLNYFFDVRYPQMMAERGAPIVPFKPITAYIPRWYHVFQSQFKHKSFLGVRRQWLHIFDDRVKGIHFTNKLKPWKKNFPVPDELKRLAGTNLARDAGMLTVEDGLRSPFSTTLERHVAEKLAIYSISFCVWRDYLEINSAQLNVRRTLRSQLRGSSYANLAKLGDHKQKLKAILAEAVPRMVDVSDAAASSAVASYGSARRLSEARIAEINARVEPVLDIAGFHWYLTYAQVLRSCAHFEKLRCPQHAGNTGGADGSCSLRNAPLYLDAKAADSWKDTVLRELKGRPSFFTDRVEGDDVPDLYEIVGSDAAVPINNYDTDNVRRIQLGLGEAWGLNAMYAQRREKGGPKYFTPITMYGAKLTDLLTEWALRPAAPKEVSKRPLSKSRSRANLRSI